MMKPYFFIFLAAAGALASLCGQPTTRCGTSLSAEEQGGRGQALYTGVRVMPRLVIERRRHGAPADRLGIHGKSERADSGNCSRYSRIDAGKPARTLSRQQNADILAYILNVNQFPAGKAELARYGPARQIRFLAERPGAGKWGAGVDGWDGCMSRGPTQSVTVERWFTLTEGHRWDRQFGFRGPGRAHLGGGGAARTPARIQRGPDPGIR